MLPALLVAMLVWLVVAVRSLNADPPLVGPDPPPVTPELAPRSPVADVIVAELREQLRAERRRVRQLTRVLRHRSSTREAIELACSVYGSCDTLWRRALCESGGYRYARNPSGASGLFQFLPSTFASTPFGRFSICSTYANALAAGWMQANGRGHEWVCR